MKQTIMSFMAIVLLCTTCSNSTKTNLQPNNSTTPTFGKTLPAWSEGHLDIHLINSARGECCFYILPDGTTLLVDAGEVVDSDITVAQRPNALIRPYKVYAEYIKHFLPMGKTAIDYCSPSHFHTDHIGSTKMVSGKSPVGYRKSGLLALYDYVPYKHILDRAYPTYTEDEVTPKMEGQLSKDWATFVTWGVKEGKFTAERFTPGKEQIVLLNRAKKYKNFSVFNICANGFVWGKDSNGNGMLIGGKARRGGNPASCGFHISYGDFDYIACGDVSWTSQNMTAFYFRDYVGNNNLDAFKCHHHLAYNGWEVMMQEFNFDPQVILNHSFAANKPHPEPLSRVLPNCQGFFATNIHPDIAAANRELIDKITGYGGHIVLRVKPGGKIFYVYMLDDSDFEYRVKSIHGPYKSK